MIAILILMFVNSNLHILCVVLIHVFRYLGLAH